MNSNLTNQSSDTPLIRPTKNKLNLLVVVPSPDCAISKSRIAGSLSALNLGPDARNYGSLVVDRSAETSDAHDGSSTDALQEEEQVDGTRMGTEGVSDSLNDKSSQMVLDDVVNGVEPIHDKS